MSRPVKTEKDYLRNPRGEFDGTLPNANPGKNGIEIPNPQAQLFEVEDIETSEEEKYSRVGPSGSTSETLTFAKTGHTDLIDWIQSVPSTPKASEEYLGLLSKDLGLTRSQTRHRFMRLRSELEFHKTVDAPQVRYLSGDKTRGYQGTPDDLASMQAVAALEDAAAEARRQKRDVIEKVDYDGTRWVQYENQERSDILRSVKYDDSTQTLEIGLAHPKKGIINYSYQDVDPTMIQGMLSARSMGAFYAVTFSKTSDNHSWAGQKLSDHQWEWLYSNGVHPTSGVTGTPPKRVLDLLKSPQISA